jgi:hypothetical protein
MGLRVQVEQAFSLFAFAPGQQESLSYYHTV